MALVAISAASVCSCSGKKADTDSSDDEVAAVVSHEESVETAAPVQLTVNDGAMDMIRDMYEKQLFEDDSYLRTNCTERLLRQLADAYDYEGDGLASWLFRSGYQDGPSDKHAIISIERLEDGWYRYKGFDIGNEFTRDVRLIKKDGRFFFDELH